MANTATITLNAQVTGAVSGQTGASINPTITLSNAGYIVSSQAITTSSTTIDLGNVGATPAGILIINQDSTNYVQIDSVNTFNSGMTQKILAGLGVFITPPTGTLYAKANAANLNILVVGF